MVLVVSGSYGLPLQKPVIGVYTEDAEDFLGLGGNDEMLTDLDASYVKYIEMAGAQVIPIFYHYS